MDQAGKVIASALSPYNVLCDHKPTLIIGSLKTPFFIPSVFSLQAGYTPTGQKKKKQFIKQLFIPTAVRALNSKGISTHDFIKVINMCDFC